MSSDLKRLTPQFFVLSGNDTRNTILVQNSLGCVTVVVVGAGPETRGQHLTLSAIAKHTSYSPSAPSTLRPLSPLTLSLVTPDFSTMANDDSLLRCHPSSTPPPCTTTDTTATRSCSCRLQDDSRNHAPLAPNWLRWNQSRRAELSNLSGKGHFTFRLEHREGGIMAQHSGEEKLLLFRSDRAGAIGKIIFSSIEQEHPIGRSRIRGGQTHHTENNNDDDSNTDHDTDIACKMAGSAKIHVLDIKAEYRGKDLGSLLFTQATIVLLQCYDTVECQLHAEEDSRRHGRLLRYYQHLGCQLKPNAKILYVNNNDGETYRKVPMNIHLHHPVKRRSLLGTNFLPIQLLQAAGGRAALLIPEGNVGPARKLDWLIVDDGSGTIQFQTTVGQYLRTDGLGICSTTDQLDDSCCFYLHHVPHPNSDENSDSISREGNDLWVVQSTSGRFLTIDCATLACSKDPAIWFTRNDSLTLSCTHNTSPRRQHYNHCWAKQTVAFVQEMRRRYLKFELTTMTLRQGLDLLKCIPGDRFSVLHTKRTLSMRARCFRTAELARANGHPDWVQLIALIHELGCVVDQIDSKTSKEFECDGYRWMRASRSRVVGCTAPDCAPFSEFRRLNEDERKYASTTSFQGMYESHCGLENLLLTWTGPEYLVHMLKHNSDCLPEEGLYILRYFSLVDWHTHHQYSHLTNDEDENLKSFVADFDVLRLAARDVCKEEMTDEECNSLWVNHYFQIAAKYGLSGELKW